MKVFLFVLCLLLGSVFNAQANLKMIFTGSLQECKEKLGIKDISVFVPKEGQSLDKVAANAKLDTQEYACLPQCLLSVKGIVDEKGSWLTAGAEKIFEDDANLEDIITSCLAEFGDIEEACFRNRKILQCIFDGLYD